MFDLKNLTTPKKWRHPGKETLPTMYDLPSEDPEEPGLPDEFHDLQPQLLSFTFHPRDYPPSQRFCGTDLNLYYDVEHPRWHKRPDWFAALGVPRLYNQSDLRLSYVIWQEEVSPFVVVELLSPGTEAEDLGETVSQENQPPTKWQVYEQILQIPYYVVFNRYNNQLRAFVLQDSRYQELDLTEPKIWMPELQLGLGLWQGEYQGINRLWLRWYDAAENWIPTEAEAAQQQTAFVQQQLELVQQQAELERQQAETARQRAEAAEQKAAELAQRLRDLGIEL